MNIQIFAERERYSNGVAIHLQNWREGRNTAVAKCVVFEEVPEGTRTDPCLILKATEAQRLMDELWNCGLRPSEGTGSAGSLAATERHLKDMQKLAFHALKVSP